jgi:hypothetical protein
MNELDDFLCYIQVDEFDNDPNGVHDMNDCRLCGEPISYGFDTCAMCEEDIRNNSDEFDNGGYIDPELKDVFNDVGYCLNCGEGFNCCECV